MSSSEPQLDLDQFKLSRAAFEARTALNFFQWDRAGQLWSEFLKKRPNLQLSNASPDNSAFQEARMTFAILLKPPEGFTSLIVTEDSPHHTLKGMVEGIQEFIAVTSKVLEFDEFTRIGLRLFFVKEYDDLEHAAQALLNTKLLQYPNGPHFGIDGKAATPSYLLRWEDGKRGAMVHLKVEKLALEFRPPDWANVEAFKKEVNQLLFDFDYYTLARVGLGQLNIEDWISNALRLTRRDSGKFLGGI